MHVEHSAVILAENLGHIEARRRHPTDIETHADPRIPHREDFLHCRWVTVDGTRAVIVDRELDVVFLHQLLEVVPLGHIFRLNDNDFDPHELRKFERLPVVLLVQRSAVHAKGIAREPARIQDRLLAQRLLFRALRIDVLGDQLQIFDLMFGRELHDFIEAHVAACPRLDAELRASRRRTG